jgi:hypothetical protein
MTHVCVFFSGVSISLSSQNLRDKVNLFLSVKKKKKKKKKKRLTLSLKTKLIYAIFHSKMNDNKQRRNQEKKGYGP